MLWLCEPFDSQFSFRVPIAQLQEILDASAPATITLPPEEPQEDFVDGVLIWGTRRFDVYFERSLGYMQFLVVTRGRRRPSGAGRGTSHLHPATSLAITDVKGSGLARCSVRVGVYYNLLQRPAAARALTFRSPGALRSTSAAAELPSR